MRDFFHSLSNLLTIVDGKLKLSLRKLEKSPDKDPVIVENITVAQTTLKKAIDLISDVKSKTRQPKEDP